MESSSLRWKRRQTGTCRVCGTTTHYRGRPGRRISDRCASCANRERRQWTREAVLDAIMRFAAANGRPPRASEWRTADRVLNYPCIASVYSASGRGAPFLRWGDAIEAAGFPRPLPGGYHGQGGGRT